MKKIKENDTEIMLGVPGGGDAEHEEDAVETIELINHRAMVELPESAVEVTLNAKIYHEGKLLKVSRTLDMNEVRTAFQKADDGYIDDEDTFVITEKGKAWLDEQQKQRESSSLF